jgi:hypothetical protein
MKFKDRSRYSQWYKTLEVSSNELQLHFNFEEYNLYFTFDIPFNFTV